MNRSEAFTQLGIITQEKQKLEEKLQTTLKREAELYDFLKIPQPGQTEKTKRHRITKEKATDIRRKIIAVMKELKGKGMSWLPLQLIVAKTNQELPAADTHEIEGQIRTLADMDGAPIKHNGMRGNGSAYSYTG